MAAARSPPRAKADGSLNWALPTEGTAAAAGAGDGVAGGLAVALDAAGAGADGVEAAGAGAGVDGSALLAGGALG